MRRTVLSIIAVLFALITNAQVSTEAFEGKAYVEVDMSCENQELSDVSIMMDKSAAKKFMKQLNRAMDNATTMANTAKKKGIKSYNKTMTGTFAYTKLIFTNKDGQNVADYNYNNYLVPYFNVDSEGNSYLLLGGYYAGYNNSNMGSSYNERSKFFFFVKIPVTQADKWANDFDMAINDLKDKQSDIDDVNIAMNDISNDISGNDSSLLSIVTQPPYGIAIIVIVLGLIAFLVMKKKKK